MLIHLTSNFFLLEYFEFISNPNIILNYHLPVAICSFTLAMKSFILNRHTYNAHKPQHIYFLFGGFNPSYVSVFIEEVEFWGVGREGKKEIKAIKQEVQQVKGIRSVSQP